jgi:hypothetical protein
MTKYRFSVSEKTAIWSAWNETCFICEQHARYEDCTIDHVLPEYLKDRPEKLQAIRNEWLDASFPGFQINDFCNWAPAHNKCNNKKGSYTAPVTAIWLKQVQQKLPTVLANFKRLQKHSNSDNILANMAAAIQRGDVSARSVQNLLDAMETHEDNPFVITFALNVEDLANFPQLDEHLKGGYPALCDWLEADLQQHLGSILSTSFHYAEPSLRTGETLSVRMLFPGLDGDEVQAFDRKWWEIHAEGTYRDLHDTEYIEDYPPTRKVVFDEPIPVKIDPVNHPAPEHARFSVVSYELYDRTQEEIAMRKLRQSEWPRNRQLDDTQLWRELRAHPGGHVVIINAEGDREKLDLFKYLLLVGLEHEFADCTPVDWQDYRRELRDWYDEYTPSPDDEDEPPA